MKELVEIIVKALVDAPDQVVITEETQNDEQVISIKVAAEDMGKVIGKQGRIAKAIRTVVKAAAIKDDTKVSVEIVQ
ncbi:MAG: KH domain-containing protein [Firmicutes bacterium]|nr:KH domain-containing protein [Bacillota bacterium]MBQ7059387.1 KH domain-containing protein [Bacillota bacterium]